MSDQPTPTELDLASYRLENLKHLVAKMNEAYAIAQLTDEGTVQEVHDATRKIEQRVIKAAALVKRLKRN